MIISIEIDNQTYKINSAEPIDVSIPLNFNGAQPNAYGVERAISTPCAAGAIVGDTRRGGSCNFEQIKFIPHCNGTHTECVGHITHERIFVRDCLQDAFSSAALISVEPENADETNDTYSIELNENDKLITRNSLESTFSNLGSQILNFESLIVRTLPNDESKLTAIYLENVPSFFSMEAMDFIVEKNIKHLLVDMPSIDRIYDEGKLLNHRIFWDVAPGSFETNETTRTNSTITELIYVPNEIADGAYLLNLQIPSFAADAAPSRPVLFRLID